MSVKVKTEEIIECDYCHERVDTKKWWRLVANHNFTATDFCSERCGFAYRDAHYYPSPYDPKAIEQANSERYSGG